MKKLMIVLIESLLLTVFVTLMSQAYTNSPTSAECRQRLFSLKKCPAKIEASRDTLPSFRHSKM